MHCSSTTHRLSIPLHPPFPASIFTPALSYFPYLRVACCVHVSCLMSPVSLYTNATKFKMKRDSFSRRPAGVGRGGGPYASKSKTNRGSTIHHYYQLPFVSTLPLFLYIPPLSFHFISMQLNAIQIFSGPLPPRMFYTNSYCTYNYPQSSHCI